NPLEAGQRSNSNHDRAGLVLHLHGAARRLQKRSADQAGAQAGHSQVDAGVAQLAASDSRLRSWARATAAFKPLARSESNPPFSSTSSAALVEPPSPATSATSCSSVRSDFASSAVAPIRVCVAMRKATGRRASNSPKPSVFRSG